MKAFQTIDRLNKRFDPNASYRLTEVYTRFFKKPMTKSHSADGDVNAMILCAKYYGIDFLNYLKENCEPMIVK